MSLLVVGLNHRSAPLPMLERTTIAPDEVGKVVAGLALRDTVREAVVLSTCNRTEIYVVTEVFHGAFSDARDALCDIGACGVEELTPYLDAHYETHAVTHLFDVASGLDSAVVGESEVLGQVRQAWEVAQRHGAAKSDMNLLFRSAIECGKRVRTETSIGRGTASVSHAAVEMLTDVLGTLGGRRVLVIGAGAMGDGVARSLQRAGASQITIANRTAERAQALAARVDGIVIEFADLDRALGDADVIVTGTASDEPILTADLLRGVRPEGSPLSIVDVAVPRDVAADVRELPGVTVFDLDDLRDWADRGRASRSAAADRARELVADAVERYRADSVARQAAPLVAALHEAAESVRSAEVERYASKLTALSDRDRRVVESLSRSIVAKLLHDASVRLKLQAGTPQGERNAAAIRDLFDLG